MIVTVNDQPKELSEEATVADLLESLGLSDRPVAVEVNTKLVTKVRHAECVLHDDDRVEIVTLVGGG